MSYNSHYGTSAGARCPCLTNKKGAVCPCLTKKKVSVPKPTTSAASVSTIGPQSSGPLIGVKRTIDRRKQLASNSNNIESVRLTLKENTVTKFLDSFTRDFSHSKKSTTDKQTCKNVATNKLQGSSTLQQHSTLSKPSSTSVVQKNYSSGSNQTTISNKKLSGTQSSVNQTSKNKSMQSSKDESSISISQYSKTDISSSTKINHIVSKSKNVSLTSKRLSKTNSLLKEQSRKQANSILESSILFGGNDCEEQSVFKNGELSEILLKSPHIISRSKSLSPGYKCSSKEEDVGNNKYGKSNLSSLQVNSHQLSTSTSYSKSASNISVPYTENNNSKCSHTKAGNQNATANVNPIPSQKRSIVTFTLNINFEDNVNSGQDTNNLAKVSIRGDFHGSTGN